MELECAVVKRNRTSVIVGIVSTIVCVASIVGCALGYPQFVSGIYAGYVSVGALGVYLAWMRSSLQRARVRASTHTLEVDGKIVRERITSAKILPQRKRGPIVELHRRLDPLPYRVELEDEKSAVDLVRALGLDAREGIRRFHIPLSANSGGLIAFMMFMMLASGIAAGALGQISPVLAWFGLAIMFAISLALYRMFRRTVTIGRDGILIEGLTWRRFIAYGEVKSIERERPSKSMMSMSPSIPQGFWITLVSGQTIFIHTMHERMRDGMFASDFLFDTAHELWKSAGAKDSIDLATLARGTRTARAWLDELRALRQPQYRVAAVSEDQLFRILLDANADEQARAAAAVCLVRGDDDMRTKVRVAIDDIAAPKLRAVVAAALEEDEQKITTALDAL